MQINFKHSDFELRHQCQCQRRGEWLIFTCSECADFERRFNYVTGEMRVKNDNDTNVLHQGTFVPVGLEHFDGTLN